MSLFTKEQLTCSTGAYISQSLFLETMNTGYTPLMTLSEHDKVYRGKTLPSLWRLYMEISDPTEYRVAQEVFGSWKLWLRLLNNKIIMQYIQTYRDELEQKILSESVAALRETATQEGSKGTAAAKYLADKGWDKPQKRKAGAPSTQEKKGALKASVREDKEINEQMKRLGLTVHE